MTPETLPLAFALIPRLQHHLHSISFLSLSLLFTVQPDSVTPGRCRGWGDVSGGITSTLYADISVVTLISSH